MTESKHSDLKDANAGTRIWRDRSAWTLVMACVFLAILGTLRRNDSSGMEPEAFWAMKSEWKSEADVVLLGDSRILRGVSPAAVQDTLVDARVLNYAFNALSYTESYLEKAEELLDAASSNPIMVLGVTPLTLTQSSYRDNGFLDYIIERNTAKLGSRFATFRRFFMPIETRELINTLGPDDKAFHRYRRYHRGGWLESYDSPEDPSENMAIYATMFRPEQRGSVRAEVREIVFNAISEWTARDIRVYGFRPPTCEAMLALEGVEAKWDLDEFIERFEAAGGHWLTFDEAKYRTYDNSHLDSDSAKRLSADLAAKIAADR